MNVILEFKDNLYTIVPCLNALQVILQRIIIILKLK